MFTSLTQIVAKQSRLDYLNQTYTEFKIMYAIQQTKLMENQALYQQLHLHPASSQSARMRSLNRSINRKRDSSTNLMLFQN